jgi:hypothetical protein
MLLNLVTRLASCTVELVSSSVTDKSSNREEDMLDKFLFRAICQVYMAMSSGKIMRLLMIALNF